VREFLTQEPDEYWNQYARVDIDKATIESLVPPGTVLWIKSDSHAWVDMKEKGFLPPTDIPEDEDTRMVQARLNIPLSTVRVEFWILRVLAG
jgi:hypothetical protein